MSHALHAPHDMRVFVILSETVHCILHRFRMLHACVVHVSRIIDLFKYDMCYGKSKSACQAD